MLGIPGSFTLKPPARDRHPINLERTMQTTASISMRAEGAKSAHCHTSPPHITPQPADALTGDNTFSQSNKAQSSEALDQPQSRSLPTRTPSPSHICLKIQSLLAQAYSIFPEHKLPGKLAKRSALPLSSLDTFLKIHVHVASTEPILSSGLNPESAHRERCQARPSQLSLQEKAKFLPLRVLGDLMAQP